MYYYKENDYPAYFSLEIIYNKFGISKSTYKRFYEFYYPERELFYQWYEKYSLDSINISYMFGDDLTFTIGRLIRLVNGDAENGTGMKMGQDMFILQQITQDI